MTVYKLFSATIIFAIALVGGLPPLLIHVTKRTEKFFAASDYVARGIFLGAGLTHLLVDAINLFNQVFEQPTYPYATVICASSIAFFYVLEQVLAKTFFNQQHPTDIQAFALVIMLSLHSMIAGTSLGLESQWFGFLSILLAILSHKGSAAFALGVKLRRSAYAETKKVYLMLLFALMTPFGLLMGSHLDIIFQHSQMHWVEGIFDAIAAGTFVYIALSFDKASHPDAHALTLATKLSCFTVGFIVMAVIAVWV